MRTIGALIFPEFELLDLYGPLEMFGMFADEFQIRIVAETTGPIASSMGPRTAVDDLFGQQDYDILLIPGGRGTHRDVGNQTLLNWLTTAAAKAEITTSVCTGSALLARAGILDGRAATTNKNAFNWVASQGAKTNWQPSARWVEDGNIFTASGVSAGIDMSLAVIARLLGQQAAVQAAQWAEYVANPDAENDPFRITPS
ncbi:MAG: DJ-1/PfpI family protein [Pikeienuella sp.]